MSICGIIGPKDDYCLKSHLFGYIFAGDQLSAYDHELVTMAALSNMKDVRPQLAARNTRHGHR